MCVCALWDTLAHAYLMQRISVIQLLLYVGHLADFPDRKPLQADPHQVFSGWDPGQLVEFLMRHGLLTLGG